MQLCPYIAALALSIGTSAALAADRVDCTGNAFKPAINLAALPDEVLASLKNLRSGFDPGVNPTVPPRDLADHGEAFTAGDVGGGPFRRFALGAVGKNRVFAAVEHGGYAYHVEIWSFELDGVHWNGNVRLRVFAVPETLPELLALTCNQLGPPFALTP